MAFLVQCTLPHPLLGYGNPRNKAGVLPQDRGGTIVLNAVGAAHVLWPEVTPPALPHNPHLQLRQISLFPHDVSTSTSGWGQGEWACTVSSGRFCTMPQARSLEGWALTPTPIAYSAAMVRFPTCFLEGGYPLHPPSGWHSLMLGWESHPQEDGIQAMPYPSPPPSPLSPTVEAVGATTRIGH